MWYIIRISFERVLRNIQKISFKDLGTMLYQGSIHYPVGKLVHTVYTYKAIYTIYSRGALVHLGSSHEGLLRYR